MNFAQIVKDLRAESGLSQMELSKKIGLSAAAIGFLELGKHEPNSSSIVAYAKYFNVSADYLLGIEDDFGAPTVAHMGESTSYSSEERGLIKKYRELNAPGKKLINTTMNTLLSSSEMSKKNTNG